MIHDGDAGVPGSLARVLADVTAERVAQDVRWGMQLLPDGTGHDGTAADCDRARSETEAAAGAGALTWRHVLAEEVLEAFAESDPERLRAELIQVAAVAVKWAQAVDRRSPLDGPAPPRERFRAIVDVHVLLLRDSEVLLGRRAGTGYGDGLWHLPSGHLEAGESATEAAVREAGEEVGVAIDPADLRFVHVMHRAPERVGLFFAADTWIGEPYNAEPHKCSEVAWWPLDGLPHDMVGYPAAAIANVLGSVPFALHEWSTPR
ncbi:NUDIX domain-containing protein [Nonomuraea sp. NPDC005650]|uniref:NUDIX hydrolase n=1 Tax=Nonomuraea sp. NPDC005650 TaxID=3157045 RepID=UPI0033B59391